MQKCHIDGRTVPGHKSLGPQGIGVSVINPAIKDEIILVISGGTGSHSDMADMPSELPTDSRVALNLPEILVSCRPCWVQDTDEVWHMKRSYR